MDRMTEDQLNAILDRQVENAMNQEDNELSEVRTGALARYRAEPDGTERPNRSHYVSPDVFETIEWAHADVLKVFTSNERFVAFKPLNPSDEEQADQESDIANYYFAQGCNGFSLMYDWTKDTLIYPNGYAHFGWRTRVKVQERTFENLTIDELTVLFKDPEIEVTAHREREDFWVVDPMSFAQLSPEMQAKVDPETMKLQIWVYDVDVKRVHTISEPYIRVLPPERVLVDPSLTSLDLDEASFVGFWEPLTPSDLLEMGFAEEDVDRVKAEGRKMDQDQSAENVSRNDFEDEYPHRANEPTDETMTEYKVEFLHPFIDFDGDGIAERRAVIRCGNVILQNKADDFQPIVAMSAIRIPHKHPGISYAQMCADIQKVKTAIWRNLLDNTYAVNGRRKHVNERALLDTNQTMRDLENPAAEIVRWRSNPAEAIMPENTPSIAADLLPVIKALDERKQVQTGVAPDVNIDPSMLQRTASEAFAQAQTGANRRIELLIRNMAETGIKRGMVKVHQLLRENADGEVQVKLHNRVWATANPRREWPERDDVIVNVGLGFANNERMLQMLFGVLDLQVEKLAPMNLAQAPHIYATVRKIVEVADIGDVAQFAVDPKSPEYQPPQPPPPDPLMMANAEMLKAQAEKFKQEEQRRMVEIQTKANLEMQKLRGEELKVQREHDLRMEAERRQTWEAEQKYVMERQKVMAEIRNTEADTEKKLVEAEKLEKEPVRPPSAPAAAKG